MFPTFHVSPPSRVLEINYEVTGTYEFTGRHGGLIKIQASSSVCLFATALFRHLTQRRGVSESRSCASPFIRQLRERIGRNGRFRGKIKKREETIVAWHDDDATFLARMNMYVEFN